MVMGSNNVYSDLHNSLNILQKFIPPIQAFEDVLTESFCRIPNKKAFDQVVYYLLNIINAKRVKQSICWPLLDAKDERQFRTAVVNFVSDINKEDSSAQIPYLVPSSLQSPSGDIIAYFLRQISSYCLRRHLNVSCDFMHYSVLDPDHNVREKIIVQEIKNLVKTLASENGIKKRLISQILAAQRESKMVKVAIKEEKMKLTDVLNHVPYYVKQYWIQDLDNNILDWTNHLNKKTEKVADIISKLKSYHKTADVLNKLVQGIVGRDQLRGFNAEGADFAFSTNNQKDFRATIFNSSGKLKLANLVNWVDLICKDLSDTLQENNGIDESIFQVEAAQTDITKYCDILTNMDNQLNENCCRLRASVSSRKRRCNNSTCLFGTSSSFGQKLKEYKLIDIAEFYKDDDTVFLERLIAYARSKKLDTSSGENTHSIKNNENFASSDNYQEICKNGDDEKTVTELSDSSKFEHYKKPSRIPIFSRKLETTKLCEQENMNRTPSIKARNGIMNLPEVVTKTPPSAITKDYMDLLVDTLYSPPCINISDNVQNTKKLTFEKDSSNSINDSFDILDNTSHSGLEHETFPDDMCNVSSVGSSFISSEFELNECNNLQRTHPTETSPVRVQLPPEKIKARPSIQALIDRYKAIKNSKAREENNENES